MNENGRTRLPGSSGWFIYPVFAVMALWLVVADREPIRLGERSNLNLIADMDYEIDGVLNRQFGGPYDYRILIPYSNHWLAELTGLRRTKVDACMQLAFVFLALVMMFHLCRATSPGGEGLMVWVLAFYLAICRSYIPGPSIADTQDMLNIVVFLAFLMAFHKRNLWALHLILAVGILNKETPLALLVYIGAIAFMRRDKPSIRLLLSSTAVVCITFFAIRLLIQAGGTNWFQIKLMTANNPLNGWHGLANNLYAGLLIGPLAIPAVLATFRYRRPLDRALLSTAGFLLIVDYVFGVVREMRMWLPVILLLLIICANPIRRRVMEPFRSYN